jgi:hypothetical protein
MTDVSSARTRNLLLGLGVLAAVLAITVAGFLIVRARSPAKAVAGGGPQAETAAPAAAEAPRALATSTVVFPEGEPDPDPRAAAAAPGSANDAAAGEAPQKDEGPALDDDGAEEPEEPAKPRPPKHFASVQEAAAGSCSTESIEGLSKQIIEQARCLNPTALVQLPTRPNLELGPHVFPFLAADAKDHLLRVLDAHKAVTMKLNSALRTVAQQYLVWRWSATKTCGVVLATRPGESNHEVGLALDVAEHATWRSALENEQFHWLGASDRVHFDYQTKSPPSRKMNDVLAFQKLWNRNHPSERLVEDGVYAPPVEQRLKVAPADGFKLGPSCGRR